MSDEKVDVITYSGYRADESPRAFLLQDKRIEVIEILRMWFEEGLKDRSRKRFFKVKGSDGNTHTLYYDENIMEWFYQWGLTKSGLNVYSSR
jgi:hypothetical protein